MGPLGGWYGCRESERHAFDRDGAAIALSAHKCLIPKGERFVAAALYNWTLHQAAARAPTGATRWHWQSTASGSTTPSWTASSPESKRTSKASATSRVASGTTSFAATPG